MLRASRIIWWVKPHSLSYQAITLTSVPSTTRGQLEVDDGGAWVADDVGGHQRILRDTEDACVAVGRGLLPERVVDLFGRGRPAGDEDDVRDRAHRDGARTAMPSKRPASSGSARVVACAAPVEVGTRLAAPARPRRKFLLGPSTSCWPAV